MAYVVFLTLIYFDVVTVTFKNKMKSGNVQFMFILNTIISHFSIMYYGNVRHAQTHIHTPTNSV